MSTEFDVIEQVFQRRAATNSSISLGIGDDAALTVPPADCDLVTATDALVAGTHFLSDAPPRSIGHRSLAVNLSDMAAMGARPLWVSLALGMPDAEHSWLHEFADGFFELCERYDVVLIGGDTVRAPALFASVTVQGSVPKSTAVTRTGACAGDLIFITGNPGAAAAGRLLLTGDAGISVPGEMLARSFIDKFLYPEPRIEVGRNLRSIATAMIDISDGLDVDLGRLLKASGCGAQLDVAAVPVAEVASDDGGQAVALELAMTGGEDYELCFTVKPEARDYVFELALNWNCNVSCLGQVSSESGLTWLIDNQPYRSSLIPFEHFE